MFNCYVNFLKTLKCFYLLLTAESGTGPTLEKITGSPTLLCSSMSITGK